MTSPLRGVKLVALDLDGTLLPASKILTDRAVGVIRDVRAAGIEVTLATGKGWNHTRRYAEELGLTAPLVALEGSLVKRAAGRKPLHSRLLTAATVHAVHEAVAGLDVGWFYCHDRGRTRAHRRLEQWLPQLLIWDPLVDLTDEPPHGVDAEPHDAYVLHFIGPPGPVAAARERVAALALGDIDLFHQDFWKGYEQLHVRPRGVDKAAGLAHVLEDLGVEPSQMLAAGDWWNDVGMLSMAGVSVVPANAVDGVKSAASHVLKGTCEDDAVVAFLEESLARL